MFVSGQRRSSQSILDTELFTVEDQEEYEKIVRLTKLFADEYRRDVENKNDRQQVLAKSSREHEIESLKMRLEILAING